MHLDDILNVLDLHVSTTKEQLYTNYGDIIADLYQNNNKFILRFGDAVNQKSALTNLPTGGVRITPIKT